MHFRDTPHNNMKISSGIAFAVILASRAVLADTITYTGTNGGNWSTATNWSNGQQPNLSSSNTYVVNGNSVLYTGVQGDWQDNTTVTLSNGASWMQTSNNYIKIANTGDTGTLNVDGSVFSTGMSSAQFYVGNGGVATLNVDATGVVSGTGATVTVQGGSVINNNGTFTADSAGLAVSLGTVNNYSGATFSGNGTLTISGNSTINNSGSFAAGSVGGITLTLGTINNYSGATMSGSGAVSVMGGSVINNSGTFTASYKGLTITSGTFNNTGGSVVVASGGMTVSNSSLLNNTGTVNITGAATFNNYAGLVNTSGTVSYTSGGTLNGYSSIVNSSGASLAFGGVLSTAGTNSISNAGTTTISGANGLTLGGNTTFTNTGTLTMGSDLRIHATSTFNLQTGVVSTPIVAFDDASSTGLFNISGGQLTIYGSSYNGIYNSGGSSFINFLLGSTGSIYFSSINNADTTDITNGLIRYNGMKVADDGSVFTVTHPDGNDTLITLAAIPEPGTWAMLAAGAMMLCGFRRPGSAV